MHVRSIINNKDSDIISVSQSLGMLSLFNGKKALHHVAPAENNSERIMTILSYSGEPNYIFCDDIWTRTLGRLS